MALCSDSSWFSAWAPPYFTPKDALGPGGDVGANATILCGIEIGKYAFIGAGSVVTSSVEAHALMIGNPAERVGWVGESGETLDNDLVCPRTGEQYFIDSENRLTKINIDYY